MEIVWLPLAEKALDDIFLFYLDKSVIVAQKMISDILSAVANLANFPEIAAREQTLINRPEGFRSLVVRHHYKVVYFVDNQQIYIADVWDCRQDPDTLVYHITH